MTHILGVTLVTIAALSWSTSGLFTRVVSTDLETTLLWHSLFGGLFVLAFYIWVRRDNLRLSHMFSANRGEMIIVVVSSAASCCYIGAFFYTSIANVSFMYGSSALVTVLAVWLLLGHRPTRGTIVASLVATGGVFILVAGGQSFSDFVGLGLAATMTILYSSIPVLTHKFPKIDTIKVAYLSAFLISIAMVPFVDTFTLDTQDLLWLSLYGVVNVFIGFCLYLIGTRMISPVTAGLIGLTEVPLAPILAAMLFAEVVPTPVLVGGLLIIGAAVVHTFLSSQKS